MGTYVVCQESSGFVWIVLLYQLVRFDVKPMMKRVRGNGAERTDSGAIYKRFQPSTILV